MALPLLALLASIVYVRANAWAALAAAATQKESNDHTNTTAAAVSPLQTSQKAMQLLRFALQDQSRTKLLVMALQVLPAALELYALVVLFVRIHRLAPSSLAAATLPLTVAAYLTCALLLCNAAPLLAPGTEHPLLRFRLVKLGLQFLVLTFLLGAAEYDAFLRLLPPALIAAGGTYVIRRACLDACMHACFFTRA